MDGLVGSTAPPILPFAKIEEEILHHILEIVHQLVLVHLELLLQLLVQPLMQQIVHRLVRPLTTCENDVDEIGDSICVGVFHLRNSSRCMRSRGA